MLISLIQFFTFHSRYLSPLWKRTKPFTQTAFIKKVHRTVIGAWEIQTAFSTNENEWPVRGPRERPQSSDNGPLLNLSLANRKRRYNKNSNPTTDNKTFWCGVLKRLRALNAQCTLGILIRLRGRRKSPNCVKRDALNCKTRAIFA